MPFFIELKLFLLLFVDLADSVKNIGKRYILVLYSFVSFGGADIPVCAQTRMSELLFTILKRQNFRDQTRMSELLFTILKRQNFRESLYVNVTEFYVS